MNNRSMGGANVPIDQLWYTWSTVGLSSVTTGFRIRAASGSLAEVMSPRVQNLDQYLRYDLPDGADRFNPENAPHSLALLQTSDGERILVNKIYQGRDGVGRPGAFFAHLLAPLPHDFTTNDAFLLWRSGFWRSSDAGMGNNLYLSDTSLAELRSSYKLSYDQLDIFQFPDVETEKLRTMLPYFISSYLLWRTEWEAWQKKGGQGQPPKHLYIAAPADMIATFFLALTLCLPDALLTDLTFSTYEKDVQSLDQTMIVGTTFTDEMISMHTDLAQSCYENDITLNCYYPDKSTPLDKYSLGGLAFAAAKNITEKLTNSKGKEKLRNFKSRKKFVENTHFVDVSMYLTTYDGVFLRERKSDKPTFEHYLTHPEGAAEYFGDPGIPAFGIRLALEDSYWGTYTLAPGLKRLTVYSNKEGDEALAQALFDIGTRAEETFVDSVERVKSLHAIPALIEIMDAFSSLKSSSNPAQWKEIWNAPLYSLQGKSKQTFLNFFLLNPPVYYKFLQQWMRSLAPNQYDLLDGLLQVPWTDSEGFFALNTPLWLKFDALEASAIPETQKKAPGPHLRATITAIITYFVKDKQDWSQAIAVYKTFEAASPQYKQPWEEILLNSPLSVGQEHTLITSANRVWFLQHYGPLYLPSQRADSIAVQFKYLRGNSQDKLAVLSTWLIPLIQGRDVRPREFTRWLESPQNSHNIERVLDIVQLQLVERATFLENYGTYYLPLLYRRMEYHAFEQTYMCMFIREYLHNLDEAIVRTSQSTQSFIATLSQESASLPPDIQNLLAKFTRFDDAFNQNPDSLNLVIAIAHALEQQSTNRAGLYQKMAQRFVTSISNETYLSEVVRTIRDISPPFTRNDLFQILLVIAQIVRDNMAQSQSFPVNQVTLYVNFAFFADVIFVKPDAPVDTRCEQGIYKLFQKNFLDRLLERSNDNLFQQLERNLANESRHMLRDYQENGVIETAHPQLAKLLPQQRVNRLVYRTELASTFVEKIANETYLAEMIRAMQQAAFTLDDLFQILFMMAQSVHDEIIVESTPFFIGRMVLYLGFVLHADIIFITSGQESPATCESYIYSHFQKNFLARLLEGINTSIRKELYERLADEDTKKLANLGYRLRTSNYPISSGTTLAAKNNSVHTSTFATKRATLFSWFRALLPARRHGNIQPTAIVETHQAVQPTLPSNEENAYYKVLNNQQPRKRGLWSKGEDVIEGGFEKITDHGLKRNKINRPR